jgi:hypothetical protein
MKVWNSRKRKFLLAIFNQNGGDIQDGRPTIKVSRFFKNHANNLQLWTLED